ncbi:MAG: hypothetical protein ACLFS2_13425 [Halochromatium sp.]|uniref:hypothetical protein n=1 Tax=Halochromatium sp. TaxID=2049430 RepID=UPI00397D5B4F
MVGLSWLFDLNHAAKSLWSSAPGQEPPYARAEATPLPVLAQRLGLDVDAMPEVLTAAGISVDDPNANLERIARANDSTPAALFALIPKLKPGTAAAQQPLDPALIEDRLVGTGVGGKARPSPTSPRPMGSTWRPPPRAWPPVASKPTPARP